jgi:hypothetical protein
MALRLLIVDDNAHFLRAARTLLEREGVRVVAVASTSAEAVRLARELRPDVTLLDIDLGNESGFDEFGHDGPSDRWRRLSRCSSPRTRFVNQGSSRRTHVIWPTPKAA